MLRGALKGAVKGRRTIDEYRVQPGQGRGAAGGSDMKKGSSKNVLFMEEFLKGKTGDEVYVGAVECKRHAAPPQVGRQHP